jgi:hypothetical protein
MADALTQSKAAASGEPPTPEASPSPTPPTLAAKADDLEAIRATVVDAAGVSAGFWLSYLFVLFYLLIAAGGVMRRSRLIGQFPGRNKLKTGSRLLVSRFPEIKFILSCCGVL